MNLLYFIRFYNGLVPRTLPNCISGLGNTTSIRRHIYSLQQLHISVLAFSYSLLPRCIRMQNLLSSQVVSATSLNCFKAAAGSQKLKFEVNQRIFIDCNLTTAPYIIRANKVFRWVTKFFYGCLRFLEFFLFLQT